MSHEWIRVEPPRPGEQDGPIATLEAHLEVERLRALERFLVVVLALGGAPLWLAATYPALFSTSVRDTVVASWAVLAGVVAWTRLCRFVRQRGLDRLFQQQARRDPR